MIIDVIFLICVLIFLIRGYSKGVVVALFSVLAIVIGVIGALKLSGAVAGMLFKDGANGGRWVPFLSYIIVFVLLVWLVRLGAKLIQRSFEMVALGWLNRLCGALLYLFLVSFVFSSALWLFNRMGVINPETRSASYVYPVIEPLAPKVFTGIGHVLPFARNTFADLSAFFDQVNQRMPDVDTH